MNTNPIGPRGGFGFRPGTLYVQHSGHPNALAWATFALVLLLVLTVGAMLVARLASRREHRGHGPGRGPRHFAFAGGPGRRPDPLDVLRWRYARGEIGRDEFLQGTSDLTARGEAPPPPPPDPPPAA